MTLEKTTGDSFHRPAAQTKVLSCATTSSPMFFKGVLGTRIGSLEFQIGFLEPENIIIGSLKSEKSGPYRSIPGT